MAAAAGLGTGVAIATGSPAGQPTASAAASSGGAAGTDPGTVMGSLFADAPGPRVSPSQAAQLGSQIPAGARIDRAAASSPSPRPTCTLTVLASPSMPAESFRIAGMTDPAIIVPAGAHVSIELINADEDMGHGLVITASGATRSTMPMMTAGPAFSRSALWFLGKPTAAGMHAGTLTFTAATPGSYQYLNSPAIEKFTHRRPQEPMSVNSITVGSLAMREWDVPGAICSQDPGPRLSSSPSTVNRSRPDRT
jgi:hypothetical protein